MRWFRWLKGEEEQAPERLREEEPERDERAEGGELPGDAPPEEPIHEA